MKVYNPRRESKILRDALKDLYLLRQEIKHQSGSPEQRAKSLDRIHKKIRSALDIIEESEERR